MAENITVKYFPEDKLINGLPVNAGDYTVKIAVNEGDFYYPTTGDPALSKLVFYNKETYLIHQIFQTESSQYPFHGPKKAMN